MIIRFFLLVTIMTCTAQARIVPQDTVERNFWSELEKRHLSARDFDLFQISFTAQLKGRGLEKERRQALSKKTSEVAHLKNELTVFKSAKHINAYIARKKVAPETLRLKVIEHGYRLNDTYATIGHQKSALLIKDLAHVTEEEKKVLELERLVTGKSKKGTRAPAAKLAKYRKNPSYCEKPTDCVAISCSRRPSSISSDDLLTINKGYRKFWLEKRGCAEISTPAWPVRCEHSFCRISPSSKK